MPLEITVVSWVYDEIVSNTVPFPIVFIYENSYPCRVVIIFILFSKEFICNRESNILMYKYSIYLIK